MQIRIWEVKHTEWLLVWVSFVLDFLLYAQTMKTENITTYHKRKKESENQDDKQENW